jgi:hypothetical protein
MYINTMDLKTSAWSNEPHNIPLSSFKHEHIFRVMDQFVSSREITIIKRKVIKISSQCNNAQWDKNL